MKKALLVDVDKCTGCGVCELVCSFQHHDEFNPLKSRIQTTVFWQHMISIPVTCYQCEDPWCQKACPAGAITGGDDGTSGARVVKVSKEKCVGCSMCSLACPFGNIVVSDKRIAEKCDHCGGDPECVKFCSPGALKFREREAGAMAKKRGVAQKLFETTYKQEVKL